MIYFVIETDLGYYCAYRTVSNFTRNVKEAIQYNSIKQIELDIYNIPKICTNKNIKIIEVIERMELNLIKTINL